ncbi:hypothetical protein KEM48_010102 [Puccinia striiformis f. sp. tritici PST-130]|nr:hypothetical protein KEM48_010102 [Puccinia striiformis f. sp. tritici PST-130]
MLAVLRFKSKGDGREIAEALQRPAHPSRVSSNVIQNGYDSPFLKPDLIVDPILKILDGYAKQWESLNISHHTLHCLALRRLEKLDCSWRCQGASIPRYQPALLLSDRFYLSSRRQFSNKQDPAEKKEERLKEWNGYTEVATLGQLEMSERTQQKFANDVLEEMKQFNNRKGATIQKLRKPLRNLQSS